MTNEEMRQLDAWIGVNVFGKKAISRDDPPPTEGTEDDYFVKEYVNISHSLPFYTANSAASLKVLKKCAEVCVVEIYIGTSCWVSSESLGINIEAPTLELAIALFTKELFT